MSNSCVPRFVAVTSILCAALAVGCSPTRTTGEGFHEFVDPETGFSSAEVFDASGDSIAFRSEDEVLVFGDVEEDGWPITDGLWLRDDLYFEVRFGTEDGEPRAFITETEAVTVCDVRRNPGGVGVYATDKPVPQD